VLDARGHVLVAGSAQSVAKAGRQFTDVVGSHHEVVEEVLAEGQVVELVVIEQQDDRPDRPLALAQLATETHGFAEGQGGGVDDGAREAVGRLQGRDLVQSRRAATAASRPSRQRLCAPALHTRARRGRRRYSQQRQVALEFEGGDLDAVGVPLGALVAQEPLDQVAPSVS
jgi:hypothetical protein